MNTLGERLYYARKKYHYTQETLADLIGVSRGVIFNLEKNKTEPQIIVVNALCSVLKINKDWLLYGTGKIGGPIVVSEQLKILLKELNLSQRQFAKKIDLDAGYFSKIVQGKVTPPNRILLLIENVFRVNPKWLEEGEGEIFSSQGVSLTKRQVLETIEILDEAQVKAVSAFIKYLTEE